MMEERTRIRAGKVLAGGSAAVGIATAAVTIVLVGWDFFVGSFALHSVVAAVGFGVLVWVIIPAQPRNREVWALAVGASFAALAAAGFAAIALWGWASVPDFSYDLAVEMVVKPADLPPALAILAGATSWGFGIALFTVLSLGLLWFPDGDLPSPRWRWVARLSVALISIGAIAEFTWAGFPSSTVPLLGTEFETPGLYDQIVLVAVLLPLVTVIISAASLVVRYRNSAATTRRQILWIGWGGAFLAAVIVAVLVPIALAILSTGTFPFSDTAVSLAVSGAELVLIVCFFVAIAKYRLYDIDVVISRTVTYGVLAVFITGVYVAVVVGIGTLVGRGGETNLGLAIAATAVVALLFEPIRSRVQRWANRLVFGERATPYAVLSELTARLSETDTNEQALERLAELVASGTGAKQAIVWLRVGNHFRPEATLSTGELDPLDSDAHPFMFGETLVTELTSVPGDAAEAIYHGGELLGVLAIRKGTRDPVTRADHDLLRDVAAGSGPLLRNIRLNAELAERAEELRTSRRRLVAAQDLERRRLERNLHDGAQQQVVAIKVKLGLAKTLAEREEADQIADAVGDLADDTQRAVDGMRVAARGIYPPLLEAEGLRAALVAVARDASIGIAIDAEDIGRYAPEIEATVYFSVLAAVAHRTGVPADGASVTVRDDREGLSFAVRGMAVAPGPELTAVADRLDALGGTLSIESEDGGTVVSGHLPTTALEPA